MKLFINAIGLLAFMFVTSCATMQKPETPCVGRKYKTSKKFFRASSFGNSVDQATSKKKAVSNARADLASSINVTMKEVSDQFVNSLESGGDGGSIESFRAKFTDNIRTVVNQRISGSIVICEEYRLNRKTKKYSSYVCVELSAKKLADQVAKQLSRDDELRVEFDYQKFQETFNSEMDNFQSE